MLSSQFLGEVSVFSFVRSNRFPLMIAANADKSKEFYDIRVTRAIEQILKKFEVAMTPQQHILNVVQDEMHDEKVELTLLKGHEELANYYRLIVEKVTGNICNIEMIINSILARNPEEFVKIITDAISSVAISKQEIKALKDWS